MRISVFGLGYVGCVSAATLASQGHTVVGVDVNPTKVEMLSAGLSPIIEKGVGDLISKAVSVGLLSATTDAQEAIACTDLSFVCVGTAGAPDGSPDLQQVRRVVTTIGQALRLKPDYHMVVIRSTMLPGSIETTILPILEQESGKLTGREFGLACNPEFLREGSAVLDFLHPPRTVIGEYDEPSGSLLASLYKGIDAPLVRTDIRTAEMVKFADNSFHALKIAFANEIGAICRKEGIDSHWLMEVFCMDTKLNISPAYLKPGYAFGGSCLPKDMRALVHRARLQNVHVPVLQAVLASNEEHKKRGLALVQATGKKRVGILGLSFKEGTDDLRESPTVELAETLIGKGYHLKIYDNNVSLSRLVGANKAYIEHEIPHISQLMVPTLPLAFEDVDVIIVANRDAEYRQAITLLGEEQILIDLVRIVNSPNGFGERYVGICW